MNNSFVKGFQAMDTAYHRAAQNKRLQVEHDQNQEDRAALGTAMQGMYDAAAGYDHPGVGPRPAIDPNDPFGGNGDPNVDAWGAKRQALNQRANVHRMGMKAAVAARDPTAFNTSNTAYQQQQLSDIKAHAATMSPDHLGALASGLNSNNSELPFVYGGVNPQGQHVISVIQKGGTDDGKVLSTRGLSESQLRQLAAANLMAQYGFGTQAMDAMSAVDKEIAAAAAAQWKTELDRAEAQRKIYETKGRVARWEGQSKNDAVRTEVDVRNAASLETYRQWLVDSGNWDRLYKSREDANKADKPDIKTVALPDGTTAYVAIGRDGSINSRARVAEDGEVVPVGPSPAGVTDPKAAAEMEAAGVTPATAVNKEGKTIWVYYDTAGTAFYDPASATASSKQILAAKRAAETNANREKEDSTAAAAARSAETAAETKAAIRARQDTAIAASVAAGKADRAKAKAKAKAEAEDEAKHDARKTAIAKRAAARAAHTAAVSKATAGSRATPTSPGPNRYAIQPPRQ